MKLKNMDKNLLENLAGQHEMFKVPEGYFDKFERQMTAQFAELSAHERKAKIRPMKYLYRVAACVLALVGLSCAMLWWNSSQDNESLQAGTSTEKASTVVEYSFDDVSDFAMLSNEDIYGYVEGE